MWMHVPKSHTSASLAESAVSTWPSDSLYQMLERSAMWRSKFLLPRIWRLVLKRNPWTTRLFGRTSEPSIASRGVDSFLASLRDSLARTTLSRGSARELSASTEISGAIYSDAFASWSHAGYFSKTSPASLFLTESNAGDGIVTDSNGRSTYFLPDSDSFLETWPRSGSMRSGRVYRQPKLALRTNESASSSWPTARAEDSESCGNHPNATDSLGVAVKEWRTPNTRDHHPQGPRQDAVQRQVTLCDQAEAMWKTPHGMGGMDASGKHGGAGGGEFAKQANNWPTPRAEEKQSKAAPLWPTPDAHAMNDGESMETWLARQAVQKAKGINGNGMGMSLAISASSWTTPQAHDSSGGNPDRVRRKGTEHGCANLADDVTKWDADDW